MTRTAPARRRPRPRVPEFHPGQILNWCSSSHWGWDEQPCRYCGLPTPLRDSHRSPAHKVCAEDALTKQYAEAIAQYRGDQL
ncbi:hypothetical protein V2S66_03120 [Streptomyces sp. V4-01]|uniref:4Fe-4S Wbl-type domain-containing protein n=1 Tax=Actinacidiphila polyblastidii TaxID=3110430 RepID=A0ABU7P5P1_9ACTN|nr:hypothetical protein [Streptomyces sp. V4-01]